MVTPESGTKTEIKRWVLTNVHLKVNHGMGLPRLIKSLRRGKRIFEFRRSRHMEHCMIGMKYWNFRFPFLHWHTRCTGICMCEIIALLQDLKANAHELTLSGRKLSEAAHELETATRKWLEG